MGLITRFEDVHVWQEARTLAKMIYSLIAAGAFSKDFGMQDQIQCAAMANIAESFDCDSKMEIARFFGIG